MRHHLTVVAAIGLLTVGVAACTPAASEPSDPVQTNASPIAGVWRLVKTTRPDGSTVPHQAGRMIFTKTHYVAVYDVAPNPRPPLPEGGAAKATADELRATYGGFNAAGGRYTLSGGQSGEITIRDEVALAPARTGSDAFLVLSYKVEGDTYTTTPLRTHAGPMASSVTFTFARAE